jgi:hypothetical protein
MVLGTSMRRRTAGSTSSIVTRRRRTLNRRNSGDRPPKTPCRRALHEAFPTDLYGQRRQVESAFSLHKRRLGSALTARNDPSQARETLLRVITHNAAIIAAI